MALRLQPPGKRGPSWYLKGRIDGRHIEKNTGTTSRRDAEAFQRRFESELAAGRVEFKPAAPRKEKPLAAPRFRPRFREGRLGKLAAPAGAGGVPSFGQAIMLYAARRGLEDLPADRRAFNIGQRQDIARLRALYDALGSLSVLAIKTSVVHGFADRVYKTSSNDTKNRDAITPARAALNYAAKEADWTPHRIEGYASDRKKTATINPEAVRQMLAILKRDPNPKKWLLVLWLSEMGTRITETLNVRWAAPVDTLGIRLVEGTVTMQVKRKRGQTERIQTFVLSDNMRAALKAIPETERRGRLFPMWSSRQSAGQWFERLRAELGLETLSFHVFRHTMLTELGNSGADLATLKAFSGHESNQALLGYLHTDAETIRRAMERRAQGRQSLSLNAGADGPRTRRA